VGEGREWNGQKTRGEERREGYSVLPRILKKIIIVLRPGMGNREGKGGGSPSQPTRGLGGAS